MKLKFVDSMRGIAILMVILVHTAQNINGDLDTFVKLITSYGQMGVQLFFVVSAYTLCLSSSRREGEMLPLFKFGIRRYFRIAPAYYLGLIIYFLISLIVSKFSLGYFEVPNKYNLWNVISNLFFIHGFYAPANNIIVPGGWSIGTEMAFYAMFPVLFNVTRIKMVSVRNIVFFVLLGILFSQLCIVIISFKGGGVSNNSFWYYNIINQLPVFLIGIGYFFLKNNKNYELNWKCNLLFFVAFTVISLKFWYSDIPHIFTIIPVISALSFVFLIEIFQKNDFLNHKLLVRIGQVSFSMYLLHFIFAHLLTEFLSSRFLFLEGISALTIFYLFSVFLTFQLALIFEKYIENPGVLMGKKIIERIDLKVLKNKK